MADVVGLLCILTLLAILGGLALALLYGARGTVAMLRAWLDRR